MIIADGHRPSPSERPASLVGAIRILPMRKRHLREVLRIEEAAYPRPWSNALFVGELAQRQSRRYMVATVGPLLVGYAGLMIVGDDGHINTLTVDPVWHSRHVGALLLLDLALAAPPLGVSHLTLEVRVGNAPALALYRRFGFMPLGIRKNYYSETGEDAIVMWAREIDGPAYAERLAGIATHLRSSP